jgi:calcineurin-like phosphoesterase family protein
MNTWFTSDPHYNHKNIAGKAVSKWTEGYRNFDSVDHMNNTLINNHNAVIKSEDEVWFLGDFAFNQGEKILTRLNGHKHLILGNHDKDTRDYRHLFVSVHDVKMIKVNDQCIWLSHYAHRVWPDSHRGVWHLYGHSHNTLPDDPHSLSFDCGVDCHDYKPLSFSEVKAIMSHKQYKTVDHHKPKYE